MKAARLHQYKKPLALDDVPTPTPGPGQVLVRIEGAGFCHSDLHVIDGEIQILPKMPLTLGHENAGRVAAVGRDVTSVKEDDPVAVYGGWGDGICDYCVRGEEQLCENPQWAGLSKWDGGYADYLLVPHERYLVKLDRLSPREAAPLTDAALTPYRAVKKALRWIEPDHPVLTIGAGGLGQYGIQFLRQFSGAPIITVDISAEKRTVATTMGAAHTLDGKDPDVAKKVREITGGHGVSAAFDFVGSTATLDLAVRSTRSLGKVVQIGLAGGEARFRAMENVKFEVQFETSLWGTVKELREVIALAENGKLALTHVDYVPLARINEAYDRVKRGAVEGRIVITPS